MSRLKRIIKMGKRGQARRGRGKGGKGGGKGGKGRGGGSSVRAEFERLEAVQRYCELEPAACRRRFLLEAFGDGGRARCSGCDLCDVRRGGVGGGTARAETAFDVLDDD